MPPSSEKRIANAYYTYGILYLSDHFKRWESAQGEPYRKYRRAWTHRAERLDHGEFPLNLNFEVTTRCNLACTFCAHSSLAEEQKFDMPWEMYTRLIEEGRRYQTPAANLNGLGEPMLVPDLPKWIRLAKEHGFLDVMFHTNGTIMTERQAQVLIESGLDRIIFSVDSPDKATYEAMRLRSRWDQVVANVRRFHEVRERVGRQTPLIRTTMVVTDKTLHQVPDFTRLWKPVADQITLQDLTWRTKKLDEGAWENREKSAIPDDMDQIRREAKSRKLSFVCPYLYQSAYAYGNGDVIPCSNPNARKHMVMGRHDQEGMAGVWQGKPYQDLRQLHAQGRWDEHPVCRECEIPLIELYKAMQPQDTPGQASTPVASSLAPTDGSGEDMVLQCQKEEKDPPAQTPAPLAE